MPESNDWSEKCPFNSVTNYGKILEERCRKARLGLKREAPLLGVTNYGKSFEEMCRKARGLEREVPLQQLNPVMARVWRKGAAKQGSAPSTT